MNNSNVRKTGGLPSARGGPGYESGRVNLLLSKAGPGLVEGRGELRGPGTSVGAGRGEGGLDTQLSLSLPLLLHPGSNLEFSALFFIYQTSFLLLLSVKQKI